MHQHRMRSLAEEREALLARLTDLLRADGRVVAAWLSGSLGRGDADSLSDIDVHVAVADEHVAEVVAGRQTYAAQLGQPLLIQERPQHAPPGGGWLLVLYAGENGAQEVDWTWWPASTAHVRAQSRVLFDRVGLPHDAPRPPLTPEQRAELANERATFVWAMAFIVPKMIARRQPTAAFDLLRAMRRSCDSLPGILASVPPRTYGEGPSPNTREPLPPLALEAQLAYLRELCADMEALAPRITAAGGSVPTPAVSDIYGRIDLVERLMREGAPSPGRPAPRPYTEGIH